MIEISDRSTSGNTPHSFRSELFQKKRKSAQTFHIFTGYEWSNYCVSLAFLMIRYASVTIFNRRNQQHQVLVYWNFYQITANYEKSCNANHCPGRSSFGC